MKCKFTRKNRDRRGGHEGSPKLNVNAFIDGAVHYTPTERKLIKKISKKKMRRQHAMTMQMVTTELNNNWTWQDQERELELEEAWYDDEPMVPYTMEELEPYPYVWDDGYDPCPMYDWRYFDHG